MGETGSNGSGARRELPNDPDLIAAAAANPGGSVAEIDPTYADDPNGYIPGEAIRGAWVVGPAGELTGEYRENPRHGPPKDDFAKLVDLDAWYGWLGDDPVGAIRESVTECFDGQAPGATLTWMKVLDPPRSATAGRPDPADAQFLIATRGALAVPFAAQITAPERERVTVCGVFTWAAINLDTPADRHDRVWLDLDADLDWAEQQLPSRMYGMDEETAAPDDDANTP
ncbi:hypothetical protein [Embleya sp. NBC_00896]|uniref:hypothetical protein n=1 Tax=Embleya sp. NBC_00896 TaxID=2975961 RepID=UPI00386318CE|nr:hypothetical protein OG928_06875 [Embleya sp. NBC_00896]